MYELNLSEAIPSPISKMTKVIWLVVILAVGVGADQWSKAWAQDRLSTEVKGQHRHTDTVTVIPKAFSFIYRENRAAAFSMTQSIDESIRKPMLLGVSALAMLFFLWWYVFREEDRVQCIALALVISGAIGNFIDRALLGYVIDFINWEAAFINPKWPPWPTFNIADALIVSGAILLFIGTARQKDKTTSESVAA